MRKFILPVLIITTFYLAIRFASWQEISREISEKENEELREYNDPGRLRQEFMMLRNPYTNKIPDNIRHLELAFAAKLPQKAEYVFTKSGPQKNVQALSWIERGPNNISGRTRVVAIDVRTTGTPTILAATASGGIWKSTDGGATWVRKTTTSQISSVAAIAQDTRTGQQDVWYAATGEVMGSAGGGGSSSLYGEGIFKSTDNGETWNKLSSTAPSNISQFSSGWQFNWNVAVHPTTGTVYVANIGGIYRSADGGTTWTQAIASGGLSTGNKQDVTIAADGTIYSAGASDMGDAAGFKKSTDDGSTWTSINPTLPGTYGRVIVKTAPSNSAVVYAFIEGVSGTNNTPNSNNHQLWRSTDAGASWTNISSVIPTTAPSLDNISTQDGYDMLLAVKPDDPNFIIVGGVSIFKIHDVTNDNMTWQQKHIGGYGVTANNTRSRVGDFINHHPDSHCGIFKPGSNVIFYTSNDGGVHYTNDITAASSGTFWQEPLRNGLNVTQLYYLSIDKTNGSGFISCGLQDRGNFMSRTNDALASFQECSGGDGSCTEIEAGGNFVFFSTSHAQLFRAAKSDTAQPMTPTTMRPNLNNTLFNTPFDADDNDGNILYHSGGNADGSTSAGIWRSTDALGATPTWTYLTNTNTGANDEQVTAVSVSKANSSNVLYYGTAKSKVFRIDNANTAAATVTPLNISGAGFPANSYVSCIAVDPDNSANVLVVFSNYGVDRLWYSNNSGTSWTSVTGNLTGENAPSTRWAKIFTVGGTTHYFLGTSTGLYYSIALNGGSTVWTQEAATSIGNTVVTGIDYRASDNTLVVGTHGRGIFQTTISTPLPVELSAFAGSVSGNDVVLNWQTATESKNYGFEIERRTEAQSWEKVGFVRGYGNSNSVKDYTFTDKRPGKFKLEYRLKQLDFDGKFSYSNVVRIDLNVPGDFVLKQNYPNPFNPSTRIDYSVPFRSQVRVEVFDITGRLMVTLVNEVKEAGNYSVNYNAGYLTTGTYFYRLSAGNKVLVKKMLLVK